MPRILTPADVTEFRNRLCEVGGQLFAEQGFDGFHMRELARRLGVSAMTPYRYFKDKETILSEVRVRAFARFADWLEQQLSAPGADDNTLGRVYAQYAIQEQAQYRLMFDLVQPHAASPSAQTAQEYRIRDVMTTHLRALGERGLVAGDPEILGLVLWSVLHGTTALHLAGKLSSQDFTRVLSNAVRLLIASPIEVNNLPSPANFDDVSNTSFWQGSLLSEARAFDSSI